MPTTMDGLSADDSVVATISRLEGMLRFYDDHPTPRADVRPDEDRPFCYFCHSSEEDECSGSSEQKVQRSVWLRPCGCLGGTKWVHEDCLRRWIEEKQAGNTSKPVYCIICGVQYRIKYPAAGIVMIVLQRLDSYLSKLCPFVLCSIICGSVYWLLVTHGALTVIQVYGQEEALYRMRNMDPFVLVGSLACIPTGLVGLQFFRWEEALVDVLKKHYLKASNLSVPPTRRASSVNRLLCYSLLLPTFACGVGKLLFGRMVDDPLKRAILGGAVTIAVKGVCVVYLKYSELARNQRSTILNYE